MSELRENFEKSFIHFDAAEYWNENLNDYEERDCSVAWRYYQAGYAQAMKEISEIKPVAWLMEPNEKAYPLMTIITNDVCFHPNHNRSDLDIYPLIPRPKGSDNE